MGRQNITPCWYVVPLGGEKGKDFGTSITGRLCMSMVVVNVEGLVMYLTVFKFQHPRDQLIAIVRSPILPQRHCSYVFWITQATIVPAVVASIIRSLFEMGAV